RRRAELGPWRPLRAGSRPGERLLGLEEQGLLSARGGVQIQPCAHRGRAAGDDGVEGRDEGRRAAGDVAAIRAAAGSFGLQLHARWAAVHRRRRHGRVLEQRVRRQDDQDTAWHEHRAGLHDEAHDEDPHARTSRVTGSEGQGGAEAEGGLQGEDPRTDYEGEVQRLHCRVRVLGRGRPEMERAARRWLHHQRQGRQPHRHGQLSARRPGQQGPRRDPRAPGWLRLRFLLLRLLLLLLL
ncbi:unnamed protein product, partial [Prorocentrum cordatum]